MYKLLLGTDYTPEAMAHFYCDVCYKQIEEQHSCIVLATDHSMVNDLPRYYRLAHKGLLNADRTAWIRKPCIIDDESEFPVSYELTQLMMIKMYEQTLRHYNKEQRLKLFREKEQEKVAISSLIKKE